MGDFADSEQGCGFFVGEVRRYDGNEVPILSACAYQVERAEFERLRAILLA